MNTYTIIQSAFEGMNRSRSARFDERRMKINLSRATDMFVRDRYNNFKDLRKRGRYFEAMQRIKDDLSTLVVQDDALSFTNNIIPLPDNYRHELGLEVLIGGLWKSADAITHSEKAVVYENYHTRPGPDRAVYYQIGRTLVVDNANNMPIQQVRLTYLRNPVRAFVNDNPTNLIVAGPTVLTSGVKYVVVNNSVTHATVTYNEEESFVAIGTALTGAGSVAVMQDTDIPSHAHEELSEILVAVLSGNVENYLKNQLKEKDMNEQ